MLDDPPTQPDGAAWLPLMTQKLNHPTHTHTDVRTAAANASCHTPAAGVQNQSDTHSFCFEPAPPDLSCAPLLLLPLSSKQWGVCCCWGKTGSYRPNKRRNQTKPGNRERWNQRSEAPQGPKRETRRATAAATTFFSALGCGIF